MEAVIGLGIFAAAVLPVAFVAFREATGRRKAEVRAATAEANATSYATQLTDSTNREKEATAREKEQRERADDLENAWLAAIAAEPVAGAHARMLAAIAAAKAARRRSPSTVPDGDATPLSRRGDSRLLAPGE